MPGPAPKDPKQRRRSNPPVRGEWIDLDEPRLAEPAQPALSVVAEWRSWDDDACRRWDTWRHDPAATFWTDGDVEYALETLVVYEADPVPWAEISRRRDRLGLTPKGKRDLRYRITFGPWRDVSLDSPEQQEVAREAGVPVLDDRR